MIRLLGPELRKVFNHLPGEHTHTPSHGLSSIDYQCIATPSIQHRAVLDAGRRYALVVCESLSFSSLPEAISDKGDY